MLSKHDGLPVIEFDESHDICIEIDEHYKIFLATALTGEFSVDDGKIDQVWLQTIESCPAPPVYGRIPAADVLSPRAVKALHATLELLFVDQIEDLRLPEDIIDTAPIYGVGNPSARM